MRHIVLFGLILAHFVACTHSSGPVAIQKTLLPPATASCLNLFPKGNWEFLHAVQATLPGGEQSTVMGITVLSTQSDTFSCVIMSIEGLVLFDACYNGTIHINRAVPPFDSEHFAQGLINDIQMIFFPPRGRIISSGHTSEGDPICRFQTTSRSIIDVIALKNHGWEIRDYDSKGQLIRTLKGTMDISGPMNSRSATFADMELTVFSPVTYHLTMRLLEERNLTP